MAFDVTQWTRLEFAGLSIYIQPDRPDWFVPNQAGDRVLRALASGASCDGNVDALRFLQRLPDAPVRPYPGRSAVLTADHLHELWFHVRNRCNLACTHCLFSSTPENNAELPAWRRHAAASATRGWR